MSRCRERGEEFYGILRIRHGDGTYLWFSVVARPRRVSGGRTMFAKESRI
ncbi:MAG: hypothetical protein ACJ8AW_07320 [Rhodopila sp.]